MLDETTARHDRLTLGDFGDLPDHERFDAAKNTAEAWFKHRGSGGSLEVVTVGDACNRLVQKYRDDGREDAAKDAEMATGINRLTVRKLTIAKLRVW